MNIPTPEQWQLAEERAADARAESVKEYARQLLNDPRRLANVLTRRMTDCSLEAEALCGSIARLLVSGESPASLLSGIAREEADDRVPYYDPEKFLTDEEDNNE